MDERYKRLQKRFEKAVTLLSEVLDEEENEIYITFELEDRIQQFIDGVPLSKDIKKEKK